METNKVIDQYSFHPTLAVSGDEEDHDVSTFAVICLFMLGLIAIAVLTITAGLYFGLHHFNLGQQYFPRWLEFIIPAIFLAACCFFMWRKIEKDETEIKACEGNEDEEDLDD